jgi:glycine oxidase
VKAGIVGAGIMGNLLACKLFQAGWQVDIFDPAHEKNCSRAAAGLLTPVAELAQSEEIIFQMGMEALSIHWPALLQQLPEAVDFQQQGSLLIAHPRDQTELTQFVRKIAAKLENTGHCKKVDQAEIIALEPALEKFQQGYYFPDEGCLDNQTLLPVLARYLEDKITWHTGQHVDQLGPGKICLGEKTHHFDLVLDCRGLGAKSSFPEVRGVRGELVWLHAPEVQITRPVRILHPRYSLYISPRANQTYLVGASEIESEAQDAISVRSMLELLTAVFYVHPGFAEARIIDTVTHCRPTLPDHLPCIQYGPGFVAVNGLYRHGFLVAPTLAADIALWVQGGIASVRYPTLWEAYI